VHLFSRHDALLTRLSGIVVVLTLSVLVPTPAQAQPAGQTATTDAPARADDDREDFEITIFTGLAVDSFAAKDLRQYINPGDSSEVREQLVAGFDFAYRMADWARSGRQLWIYGQTVHGVRSGEADCGEANAASEICEVASLDREDPGGFSAPLAIFRKASTFEAFMGLQGEFLTLRSGSGVASKLYLKAQLGLLTVAGRGGDVVDMHHGAIGLIMTTGDMAGSYVEIGYGTNELFLTNPHRWKIDGFITFGSRSAAVKPFAEVVIDADFNDGADNIQSFFGLDIDVREAFRRRR
jgi:hypothetical protein